jgi:hypothetical protein
VNLNDVQTLDGPAKMLCKCEYVTPVFMLAGNAFDAPIEMRISTIGQFQSFDTRQSTDMVTMAVLEPNDTLSVGAGSAAVTPVANAFTITYGTISKTFAIPAGIYTPGNLEDEMETMVNAWLAVNGNTNSPLLVTFDGNSYPKKFQFFSGTSGTNWSIGFPSTGGLNAVLGFAAGSTSTPQDWNASPQQSTNAVDAFDTDDTFKGYKFGGSLGDTIVNREFLNQQTWLVELVYTNTNTVQGDLASSLVPIPLEDWMAVLSFRW